jgi:hypothetical protein
MPKEKVMSSSLKLPNESRRFVAMLAAILAAGAATAQAAPFRASGTDEITSIHGNQGEGVSRGVAQPGGPFAGVWSATQHGYSASGFETWDFGGVRAT